MFFSILILSILLSISSNSFLGIWMGLEINLTAIIPIFLINQNGKTEKGMLTFFLIQSISSMLLLMMFTLNMLFSNLSEVNTMFIYISIFMKMGLFPFSFWVPKVMDMLSWMNCFILSTIQKIIPLILIFILSFNKFILIMSITNIFFSTLTSLNQFSLRKIMAFSSLNHLSMMILTIFVSKKLLKLYFFLYSYMSFFTMAFLNMKNFNFLSQSFFFLKKSKIEILTFTIIMLSMAGTPPFLGFFPKLMVIMKIVELDLLISNLFILISSSIATFFYLRTTFSSMFIFSNFMKLLDKSSKKNSLFIFSFFLSPFILFF